MRKFLVGALKLGLSAGIICYLVWEATAAGPHASVFTTLREQAKDWNLLALAFVVFLVSVVLPLVRWWCLARALGVPCRLGEVLRCGFWGLLFNLAPLGVVSGDVVRALLLARKHPDCKSRVIASVLVDRVVGVYMLFVLVALAIPLTGFSRVGGREVALVCDGAFACTVLGTVGIGVILIPGSTGGWGLRLLGRLPRVGRPLQGLMETVRLYRHRPGALALCGAGTLAIHTLTALSCYLIARGLGGEVVPLADQLVVVPISLAACILPLPLGPFEFMLEFLYTHLPLGLEIPRGQGLVVALVFRLMGIVAAAAGVLCSFGERREVAESRRLAGQDSGASAGEGADPGPGLVEGVVVADRREARQECS